MNLQVCGSVAVQYPACGNPAHLRASLGEFRAEIGEAQSPPFGLTIFENGPNSLTIHRFATGRNPMFDRPVSCRSVEGSPDWPPVAGLLMGHRP